MLTVVTMPPCAVGEHDMRWWERWLWNSFAMVMWSVTSIADWLRGKR